MSDDHSADSSTSTRLPYTVCVEGNIGSGKSTFLSRCAGQEGIEVLPEPIGDWMDVGGVNLLERLYADPAGWGMTFQTFVTLSMLKSHLRSNGSAIKVMERSLFSARHCFVESMLAEGSLQPGMYGVLQEWYEFIDEFHQVRADVIIYLRTSPEVAYQRLRSRGRSEEGGVPLSLLRRLHDLHETWIERERSLRGTPVITIEADSLLPDLEPQYDICIANMFAAVETIDLDA